MREKIRGETDRRLYAILARQARFSLILALFLCFSCGCAVVRSPLPPYPVIFIGWGKLDITHSKDASGELFSMTRDINTAEVLGEIIAAGGTIVSILAMCI